MQPAAGEYFILYDFDTRKKIERFQESNFFFLYFFGIPIVFFYYFGISYEILFGIPFFFGISYVLEQWYQQYFFFFSNSKIIHRFLACVSAGRCCYICTECLPTCLPTSQQKKHLTLTHINSSPSSAVVPFAWT